jgi:hypothetical protein
MGTFHSVLRRIPEPSVNLYLGLSIFGMMVFVVLGVLNGIK